MINLLLIIYFPSWFPLEPSKSSFFHYYMWQFEWIHVFLMIWIILMTDLFCYINRVPPFSIIWTDHSDHWGPEGLNWESEIRIENDKDILDWIWITCNFSLFWPTFPVCSCKFGCGCPFCLFHGFRAWSTYFDNKRYIFCFSSDVDLLRSKAWSLLKISSIFLALWLSFLSILVSTNLTVPRRNLLI